MRADGTLEIVDASAGGLLRHDPLRDEPGARVRALAADVGDRRAAPLGVFRSVERPVYDDLVPEQIGGVEQRGEGDLAALLHGGDTWTIG